MFVCSNGAVVFLLSHISEYGSYRKKLGGFFYFFLASHKKPSVEILNSTFSVLNDGT